MKVTKLPFNPGPAAWNSILPSDMGHPELNSHKKTDWLIIGAGFAGLSAARRLQLRRPFDRITVLEAKRLAEGPAGRNSGFMIDLPHDLASKDYGGGIQENRKKIEQNRFAVNFARKIVNDLELPREAFQEVGKVNAAATTTGMQHNLNYKNHLTDLKENFELYDAQQMKELTGTTYYLGGLFTPGTVMLQPALYIRELGKKLISNKLKIYENSPVISLVHNGFDWHAKTPKGSITTQKIILATNGHVENFGLFKRRIIHLFTYGSMTRGLTPEESKILGGKAHWGLTSADPLGTTVRKISTVSGDRIVIRNRVTYEPEMRPKTAVLKRIYAKHTASFCVRFPNLKDVQMAFNWGGQLAFSLNNVPAFGEAEKGLFTACCQNGLGTVNGTLQGAAAADYAMGINSKLIDALCTEDPPKKLLPEPITRIGANLRILFGEFKAGAEL
ncbi:MAG: FAD-binding oxidoreductase [Paracoccaceae bacterium]|nr:FAD-binding oxidoreductase [Paracoccaceae bacterium]